MSDENERFVDSVIQELGEPPRFSTMAEYNEDGDCLEFLVSNEPYYAERLDGWVTVYRSEKTHHIVGGMIKSVMCHLLQKFPGLRLEIKGSPVKVTCLLRAASWQVGDDEIHRVYTTAIDEVEKHDLMAELQLV